VQKGGYCIEGLPTCLFRIIQLYLSKVDYHRLMNSNLGTFQSVKYETAHFNFDGGSHYLFAKKEIETILTVLDRVKDKSKQITFVLRTVNGDLIRKFEHLFQGARRVRIDGKTCSYRHCQDSTLFELRYQNMRTLVLTDFRASLPDIHLHLVKWFG
jgi:hypothetical protein